MSVNKYIKECKILLKAQRVLFFASIFLASCHFFLVWRIPQSYLNGIFIDYWAPKLYASHLAVWLLWITTLLSRFWGRPLKKRPFQMAHFGLKKMRPEHWAVALLTLALVTDQLLTPRPVVSLFGLINLATGPVLLLQWIIRHRAQMRQYLPTAVVATGLFQGILGLWQFLFQKSLAGYWFFGEPNLQLRLGLAKSALFPGERVLPYGTTPHPNILAAWMILAILGLLTWRKSLPKVFLAPLFTFFLAILFLTESLTAWMSLVGALLVWYTGDTWLPWLSPMTARKRFTLMFFFLLSSVFWVGLLFGAQVVTPSLARTTTFSRRIEGISLLTPQVRLQATSQGYLGHIALLSQDTSGSLGWRFLQPVHNGPLFVLSDISIWVIILFFLFYVVGYFYYSMDLTLILLTLPFFHLDHYIVSTNSGQFFFLLFLCFFTLFSISSKPR